jgi:hypothetical protein
MKNFLDLTDIDTSNLIEVKIELALHNDPEYVFSLNGIAVTNINTTLYFDLLANLEFRCTVTAGVVEILDIQVNNQTILPLYLNRALPPTSWITGAWEFDINEPFYVWLHQITGQGWIA